MSVVRLFSNIFSCSKKTFYKIYNFIPLFPSFIRSKINFYKDYTKDVKYKLNNLAETNFNLGIYHLNHHNINDAIIRFKLVMNFLDKTNKESYYYLGWCYFIKNNHKKALIYLENAKEYDKIKLLDFIKDYDKCSKIPSAILKAHRNYIGEMYVNNFNSQDIHLPYRFIQKTSSFIKELPDHYNIIELGSNIGLIGYEIKKRLPESFILKGAEISSNMIELCNMYYQNTKIYDTFLNDDIESVISNASEKFEVIISFCGLTFTNQIQNCFESIHNKLNKNGYFICCLPVTKKETFLSIKRKEFIFNINSIKTAIDKSNFALLYNEAINISQDNDYLMIVCQKN